MNLPRALLLPFALSALVAAGAQDIQPDPSIPEAPASAEVLARVAERYRNLSTYQDEGVSLMTFEGTGSGHSVERRFSTVFSRPGQFRFEFSEAGGVGRPTRYVVWQKGEDVRSWWTIQPEVKRHDNLGSALAGATGVSGGTAYTIPSILTQEAAWKGSTWTASARTYRIEDGIERGTPCFRIQRLTATKATAFRGIASPASKGKVTYWISKDRFLLLRVDGETDFGSFLARDTVQYSPVIDGQIQAAAFEFGH